MISHDEDEEEYVEEEEDITEIEEETSARTVSSIPTLLYYQRTYARSMGDNDQKAVGAFKQYEAQEKVRRMQNELMLIKASQVREEVLDSVVGKKRKSRHNGYEHWSELMLLWLVAARA